ncbi:MAG: hypothetical protein QM765_35745 [Myxococcales bacterium]
MPTRNRQRVFAAVAVLARRWTVVPPSLGRVSGMARDMTGWTKVLKANGLKARDYGDTIFVTWAGVHRLGAGQIVLKRAPDGRLHLFTTLLSGAEIPFEDRFDEAHAQPVAELAARFNRGRFFELLDADLESRKLCYKALLLSGFRSATPKEDRIVSAVRVHVERSTTVLAGFRALLGGESPAAVAARLNDTLGRYHPLEDGTTR